MSSRQTCKKCFTTMVVVCNQWFCGETLKKVQTKLWPWPMRNVAIVIVLPVLTIIKHGLHVCIAGPRYPRAAASLMIIIWFVCQHSATSPPPHRRQGPRKLWTFPISCQSLDGPGKYELSKPFSWKYLERQFNDTKNIKFDIFNKTESKWVAGRIP